MNGLLQSSALAQSQEPLPQLPKGPDPQLPQLPGGQIPGMPQVPGNSAGSLPHDIRGLAEYPFQLSPGMIVTAILIIAAVAAVVFWWYRKRKHSGSVRSAASPDPLAGLQKEISQLIPTEPFGGKIAEDYFYNLGFRFRGVIEHCCKFPATDLTVKELKAPVMKISALNQSDKLQIMDFLVRSDMIKFAGSPTQISEAQKYHSEVTSWVTTMVTHYRQTTGLREGEAQNQNFT